VCVTTADTRDRERVPAPLCFLWPFMLEWVLGVGTQPCTERTVRLCSGSQQTTVKQCHMCRCREQHCSQSTCNSRTTME
jgi:hypothetical protein